MSWLSEIIPVVEQPSPATPEPVAAAAVPEPAMTAAAWNALARAGAPAGDDPRAWAAGLLDQLERDDTRHMFYQVDWQAFRKLESLEITKGN